jgi:hypothetical protein
MKSNEVGTTLKHPETINGNVKNLSKRMKMKDKGECHFKNLTLPLITTLSCTPKHLTTPTFFRFLEGFRMNAPWTLPQKPGSAVFDKGARSLKTLPKGSVQGAHLGARSLNAPLGSAIRERVRGGGGALPRSLDLRL